MKITLSTISLLIVLHTSAQGILGSGNVSDNGVEILMQDGFSSASLDLTGSPRDLTKWTKSTESGSPANPTLPTTSWGTNIGYETGSTTYLQQVVPTSGGVYLWSPSITLPNRTDLFARITIRRNGFVGGGTFTIGMAFDQNNDQVKDGPSQITTTFTGGGPYNNDYASGSFFPSATNYIRTVYFDLTTFANYSGRLGILLKGSSMTSAETYQLDWFVVGTRPTNDLCSGAYALSAGSNGGTNGFYNSTANGLIPCSSGMTSTYEGGSTIYVGGGTNGTGSIPSSGGVNDGYQPTSPGPFGTTASTIENSTWYVFTTPDATACASGTLTGQFTLQNLHCATNITNHEEKLQARVFTSGVCGSSSAPSTYSISLTGTPNPWVNNTTLTTASINYNTTYYLLIDAINANDCRFNIDVQLLVNGSTSSGCTILPVELLNFEAVRNKEKIKINWTTVLENNNDHFTIERSENATNFYPILIINGAGNSGQTINYSAIDETPPQELTYYRLKQTDFNGNYSYSSIISVDATDAKNKNLVRSTNIFGEEVPADYTGIKINFYSDGSVKKIVSY